MNRSPFKKRNYLEILRCVITDCLKIFGYRIRPQIYETQLPAGQAMLFSYFGRHYAIFYDYLQFKKIFGKKDYETQEAYAASIAAHEMRHYYQVRQLQAKSPREDDEAIAAWRKNDEDPKLAGEGGCTVKEFYLQPMELDAELFAYVYVVLRLERAVSLNYISGDYVEILRKRYRELYGETEELSMFDVDFSQK